MNRITRKIRDLKETGGKAVIPYMTPEFPHTGITSALLNGLTFAGADMIEVGIPFSDPLADGKTIQHSSEVAIRNGVTISGILRDVRRFRSEHDLPLILMGYVNPILRYGVDRFAQDAAEAGVDGLIVPDLPPEEASDVTRSMNRTGLSTIFLIAPTTSSERISKICWRRSTHHRSCVYKRRGSSIPMKRKRSQNSPTIASATSWAVSSGTPR